MKKVCVVTGASSGMGKDGALKLIKEGHIVYGLARRVSQMTELVAAGGFAIETDVTSIESIERAVAQIVAEQGRIDVLWNNAGYSVTGAVEDVSYEDAKRQFEVNLFGLAEMTKAVLPTMRKQKSGTIINTSSVGGKIYTPLGAWYHASKHALEGWSDCLRLELKPFNINVVIIEPGGISSEFGDVLYQPLVERAKGGAYQAMSTAVARTYKAIYSNSKSMSSPAVIGELVVRIVASNSPRTRYIAGYMSRTILCLRSLLSDRIFDKVIMSTYEKELKKNESAASH
ncbi:oxidoreductase [Shewanella zhangzhouensis]|uniref:oxidoreductase n=1 Tax=Shewanella zhangzhouensis TaxID=2864213 RepID=UPI001C65A870|nr:oxidoreductase [Shewanella zhangzhouensis]QYK04373.1 SDR family NAD(P)-dependent oxidoreductase [Shewanella zhangzhouensis]